METLVVDYLPMLFGAGRAEIAAGANDGANTCYTLVVIR